MPELTQSRDQATGQRLGTDEALRFDVQSPRDRPCDARLESAGRIPAQALDLPVIAESREAAFRGVESRIRQAQEQQPTSVHLKLDSAVPQRVEQLEGGSIEREDRVCSGAELVGTSTARETDQPPRELDAGPRLDVERIVASQDHCSPWSTLPGAASGAESAGTTQPVFPNEVAPPIFAPSTTVTGAPRRASSHAAQSPTMPPPTTTTDGCRFALSGHGYAPFGARCPIIARADTRHHAGGSHTPDNARA
jgi:hypothetical protein